MNLFFFILGIAIALPMILFFAHNRRINVITIISSIMAITITIMIGNVVFSQVVQIMPVTDNSTMNGMFSILGTKECTTGEYIPVSDIQKKCENSDRTISIQSCDDTGRICTSKSIDCKVVNSEGANSIEQDCKVTGGLWTMMLVIGGVIIALMIIFAFYGHINIM